MNKFLVILIVVLFTQLTGCASTVSKTTGAEVEAPVPEFTSACARDLHEFNERKKTKGRVIIALSEMMTAQLIAARINGVNVGGFADHLQVFIPSEGCLEEERLAAELREKQADDESVRREAQAYSKAAELERKSRFFGFLTILFTGGLIWSIWSFKNR